jgi:hypothetical protein
LNQRGFLFADSNDTHARCTTFVSVFALSIDDLEQIRENSPELDKSVRDVEAYLLSLPNSLAIDYILKIPKMFRRERSAEVEARRN